MMQRSKSLIAGSGDKMDDPAVALYSASQLTRQGSKNCGTVRRSKPQRLTPPATTGIRRTAITQGPYNPGPEVDGTTKLVQSGAMARTQKPSRKRFSVSLDHVDYDALQKLGAAQRPPLKQQYLVELAIKDLLDRHANKQLSFPLRQAAS